MTIFRSDSGKIVFLIKTPFFVRRTGFFYPPKLLSDGFSLATRFRVKQER